MVVGRVTKFAAVSLLTGTLSLGFAAIAHAESTVTIDNYVNSGQMVGGSGSSGGTTGGSVNEKDSVSTANTTQITVKTVSNDKVDKSLIKTNASVDGDGSGNVSSGSTATEVKAGPNNASKSDSAGGSTVNSNVGGSANNNGSGGQASVLSNSSSSQPVAVSPNVAAQLQVRQPQFLGQTAVIRRTEVQLGAMTLADTTQTKSSAPDPAAPVKDLPIQGALQGFASVLSATILPLGSFSAFLTTAAQTHGVGVIILVIIVLSASTLVAGRFVDMLRASGYAHAARADASNHFFFATPSKSEFFLGLRAQSQLTFFGVRNKVLGSQIST